MHWSSQVVSLGYLWTIPIIFCHITTALVTCGDSSFILLASSCQLRVNLLPLPPHPPPPPKKEHMMAGSVPGSAFPRPAVGKGIGKEGESTVRSRSFVYRLLGKSWIWKCRVCEEGKLEDENQHKLERTYLAGGYLYPCAKPANNWTSAFVHSKQDLNLSSSLSSRLNAGGVYLKLGLVDPAFIPAFRGAVLYTVYNKNNYLVRAKTPM